MHTFAAAHKRGGGGQAERGIWQVGGGCLRWCRPCQQPETAGCLSVAVTMVGVFMVVRSHVWLCMYLYDTQTAVGRKHPNRQQLSTDNVHKADVMIWLGVWATNRARCRTPNMGKFPKDSVCVQRSPQNRKIRTQQAQQAQQGAQIVLNIAPPTLTSATQKHDTQAKNVHPHCVSNHPPPWRRTACLVSPYGCRRTTWGLAGTRAYVQQLNIAHTTTHTRPFPCTHPLLVQRSSTTHRPKTPAALIASPITLLLGGGQPVCLVSPCCRGQRGG